MATSRVGRKPITVPNGVEVKVQDQHLAIKGPKGQKLVPIHPNVHVVVEDKTIMFTSNGNSGYVRSGSGSHLYNAITGTMRATVANFVEGVANGFERKLELRGVGYRAAAQGKVLNLTLGFSHPVKHVVPEGITIETPTQTEIIVKGIDKHLVGHVASEIRAYRPPEPYKGKGVRYSNEVVEIKETKKK